MIKLINHPLLPVEKYTEPLSDAMEQAGAALLLSAEPGAGKSTIVPLLYLDADWRQGRKIIMLEPRRIAARAAASRMAQLLGEKVGERVGYRTGLDSKCGADTVIEVVTEAILTRMLQRDPELPDVALIIFDEFHERSIHADLGLALSLDVRANLRDDLRILVMSATLDIPSLQRVLPDAQTIHIPGRMFPVRTVYSDILPVNHNLSELAKGVAGTIRNALAQFPGDVLVFLPGEAEIRRVCAALADSLDVDILPLYGNLPAAVQDKVFQPSDRRKVIVASAIAETSLTIDGVRIVIDAGLMRVPVFSPATGMNRLSTIRVSAASAEQRKGRAGRTDEGICIRLWHDKLTLPEQRPPEIMESDLCELTLELLNWGVAPEKAAELPFPDAPPEAHLSQAMSILKGLGAANSAGQITAHGKKLLSLPVHPRLGQMLLRGNSEEAVRIAAILSERREGSAVHIADYFPEVERNGIMKQTAERLRKYMGQNKNGSRETDPGILLALAYPDRIARRRGSAGTGNPQYVLANGIVAELDQNDPLCRFEFLAAGETSTAFGITKIRLAAPLDEADVYRVAKDSMEVRQEALWDADAKCVRCYETEQLGSLTLKRKQIADPPEELLLPAFLEGIRKTGGTALGLSKKENGFRERVTFLHHNGFAEEYPDYSEPALLDSLEDWLAPYIAGFKRLDELKKLNCRAILENAIPPRALSAMLELAPEKIEVPSGSCITVDYSDPKQPAVSVRLQEIFGMKSTPRLAGGKVSVLMDILSPAMRTVQKTRDLESFWKESYFLVRKDMRGRYPKHDWPEDPTAAVAHRGVRRKTT